MFNALDFKGRKALIIGAGKSGIACANLLFSKGFDVFLTENKHEEKVKNRLAQLSAGISYETGGHTDAVLQCGFAVKCPGLPHDCPILAKLAENNIPVFSETEIGLSFIENPLFFAITGTNGKTTTTMLLGSIMARYAASAGLDSFTAGNIGTPVSSAAMRFSKDVILTAELSSYQLEDSTFIAPHIAAILNITPDHLEHHGSMDAYIEAKKRIFKFQKAEDFCVLNYEDGYCRKIAGDVPGKLLWFSSDTSADIGGKANAFIRDGKLAFRICGREILLTPPDIPGIHNMENAMAAGLVAIAAGVPDKIIQQAFDEFRPVEHRIEPAGTLCGIRFINDSKATNVDSVLVALKAMPEGKKTWLILGGRDKGAPYSPLIPLIREKAKGLMLIGEAADRIYSELGDCARCYKTGNVFDSCLKILELGRDGDIALFSPACSSFDQFADFEDRGRKFKEFLKGLDVRPYQKYKPEICKGDAK